MCGFEVGNAHQEYLDLCVCYGDYHCHFIYKDVLEAKEVEKEEEKEDNNKKKAEIIYRRNIRKKTRKGKERLTSYYISSVLCLCASWSALKRRNTTEHMMGSSPKDPI